MAIQVERMVAILEARLDKYEKGLAKAASTTNRQFTAIERRGKVMESRLANVGAGVLGSLAAGASLRGAQQLLDAATRIDNALKVAGLSGDELNAVYGRLYASAQKNAAPLESLVTLYSRAALVQKELGVSTDQLLGFTDNIALALRVAGTDAQSASGALLQLSQALGSGVVRAEEFNSILEGAPTILQAAAAGIKQAEGSVAKLRQIMLDGGLSSRALFDGVAAGAVVLEDKVAGSSLTISQALENLQTELVNTAREFNKSTGASTRLAQALTDVVIPAIGELGGIFTAISEGPLGQFVGLVSTATDKVLQLAADIGSMTGLDKIGGNPYIGQGRIQDRIDGAFAGTTYSTPKGGRAPTDIGTIRTPNAIDLADQKYKPAADSKGGGGRSTRTRQNDYQREIEQIKERTAAIQAETAAMAGINPLVNDYGYALEKARTAQDLLTAAKRAGIAITPELKAQIDQLADGYASASAAAEQLAESQDRAREIAEDFRGVGKDVLGGFISDLRAGKDASEALANAMNKVLDKLAEIGLNSVFDNLFSSGGGGFIQALLGGSKSAFTFAPGMGLWSSGGYTGPGGKYQPAGVVHKGEYVFDQASVRAAGGPATLDALRQSIRGYANGGYVGLSPRASQPRPASAPQPGNGTVVNIIDNAGVEKRTERRRGPDGSDIIDIVVERVKGDLAGGGFDKAMGGRFGALPKKVTR